MDKLDHWSEESFTTMQTKQPIGTKNSPWDGNKEERHAGEVSIETSATKRQSPLIKAIAQRSQYCRPANKNRFKIKTNKDSKRVVQTGIEADYWVDPTDLKVVSPQKWKNQETETTELKKRNDRSLSPAPQFAQLSVGLPVL